MSPQPTQRARQIFMEVAELPAGERAAALDRACGGDAALRGIVQSLLDAHDEAGGFLHAPTANAATVDTAEAAHLAETVAAPAREKPGMKIGPYKLLQLIGEGGFGSVFMAQQERPVQRKVALKIIKLGMDTRQVVARFEQERQALAMMDHPNIARVLDAGATEVGRPFFVMELVTGDPIVEYCDRNRLGIQERLQLFAQVCSAVQHAHTKGIIHRDIKPSNVLVSTQDGRPFAKVIDFGIAKATSAQLTEKTLFTEHRQLLGTPVYMSPEQAEGSLDLDTRTDVYSLGVLLYELLTGSTPFEASSLRAAAYGEIQRIIREVEPPAPSTRLSQNTATLASVASSRHTEPKKLGLLIRGELDWIVMKAMEKDRQRRYETANGLAMDVQRYLEGQAVVAAPPSRAYLVRKFIRRHRSGVFAAGLVAAALVLGIIGTTWGMMAAARERAIATDHAVRATGEAQRAQEAEQQAQRRSEELEQVARFQAEQLRNIDASVMGVRLRADLLSKVRDAAEHDGTDPPPASRAEQVEALIVGADFTGLARQALEAEYFKPGLEVIEQKFADQPLVKARLLQSLVDAAFRLGLLQFNIAPQREALEIRRKLLGDDDPATIESIQAAASLAMRLSHFEESERLHREALERTRRVFGEESEEHIHALTMLSIDLSKQSKEAESDELRLRAYEIARKVLGEEHETTLDKKMGAAGAKMLAGNKAEAEAMFREVIEVMQRTLPPDAKEQAGPEAWLGICLASMGRGEEGDRHQRRALEIYRRHLGDDHSTTMNVLNNLGWQNLRLGRYEEAERELTEAYERRRRVFGENHQDTLASVRNLGELALKRGQFEKAESLSLQALEGMRRLLGNHHYDTHWAQVNVARALAGQKRYDEAESYFRAVVSAAGNPGASTDVSILNAHRDLANLLADTGRHEEAAKVLRSFHERLCAGADLDEGRRASCEKLALALAGVYESWHAAKPGEGHDARAAEWRTKYAAPAAAEKPEGSP